MNLLTNESHALGLNDNLSPTCHVDFKVICEGDMWLIFEMFIQK